MDEDLHLEKATPEESAKMLDCWKDVCMLFHTRGLSIDEGINVCVNCINIVCGSRECSIAYMKSLYEHALKKYHVATENACDPDG